MPAVRAIVRALRNCPTEHRSKLCDVDSLRTLLALDHIVLNLLTFVERLEAFHIQSGIMNEDIMPFRIGDKAVTLLVIKPFNSTFIHVSLPPNIKKISLPAVSIRPSAILR